MLGCTVVRPGPERAPVETRDSLVAGIGPAGGMSVRAPENVSHESRLRMSSGTVARLPVIHARTPRLVNNGF